MADTVCHNKEIESTVGSLSSQQLPQHHCKAEQRKEGKGGVLCIIVATSCSGETIIITAGYITYCPLLKLFTDSCTISDDSPFLLVVKL